MPKNLAQWVGNELVKELELELAEIKDKIESSKSDNGLSPGGKVTGDAQKQIQNLVEELSKAGEEIAQLQAEQERLRKVSGRSAKGELRARLDAAIKENLQLRRRRDDLKNLLDDITKHELFEQNDQKPELKKKLLELKKAFPDCKDSKEHDSLRKKLDSLKKHLQEAKAGASCSKQEDVGKVIQAVKENFNLKTQLNDFKIQLDARQDDPDAVYPNDNLALHKRVEYLETEIARLKNELESLKDSLSNTTKDSL